jgi:diguanylate cyclase (GGDEF)-like protein
MFSAAPTMLSCRPVHRPSPFASSPFAATLLAWLVLLLAVLFSAPARAAPLVLSDAAGAIDAWPAVTMFAETGAELTVQQVQQQLGRFEVPTVPHANLGPRREAVWLRVPLQVPVTESGRWMLDIDYPPLDRVDVHVVSGGVPVRHETLGDLKPFSMHPMATRSHALTLVLEPGQEHELLLRVETASSMIVPVRLVKAEAFQAGEARVQMLQGLMTGIGLCLLLYSLAQWFTLRDTMFLHYAVTLAGTTSFFFAYYGLGAQHLWPDNAWLGSNAPALAVLIALGGGMLFIARVLDVHEVSRTALVLLKAGSWIAFLSAAAFALGLTGYRTAQVTGTVLGPVPILLAVPVAYIRVRRGDRAALYIFIGWGVYAFAVMTMAALLRGLVGSNVWTQHVFQAGAMFEMVMWLGVLGVRMDDLRLSAQRATLERDSLRSLAHSDPLTGLPNRRGLNEALTGALAAASAERVLSVFMIDLDGFKAVNDRLGHDAGDALLVLVARRLRSLLRASDVVARLGGDEFVVMAPGLPSGNDAQGLGRKLLDGFDAPFDLSGQTVRVGLTIGYALAPFDGNDAASLLKRADAAMYAGKQAGRHCLRRGGASVGLVAA